MTSVDLLINSADRVMSSQMPLFTRRELYHIIDLMANRGPVTRSGFGWRVWPPAILFVAKAVNYADEGRLLCRDDGQDAQCEVTYAEVI